MPYEAFQFLALAILFGGGAMLAWGTVQAAARLRRAAGTGVRRLVGHPAPAPWEPTGWACLRCRSVNRGQTDRCARCRAPRVVAGLPDPPATAEPDVIPIEIRAAGAIVVLEHNAAAHADGLVGHWRLRVNGSITGTAARQDGALALLLALRDADAVFYDLTGKGTFPYPSEALAQRFAERKLPVPGPCPERR